MAFRSAQFKYLQDAEGNEYLFDVSQDPNETTNLATTRPQQLKQMKNDARQLAAELRKSDD